MQRPTPSASSTQSRAPQRVLIIRPSALGDVCRSVGVLALLRSAYPHARIDWLVQDSFADAVRYHPALTKVVEFPRSAMADWWRSPAAAKRSIEFIRMLRTEQYDLVIDCQGLLRSGLFTWATRAPRRLGYADAAEGGAWFVNQRVDAPRSLHTVDRMMRLADAAVGGTQGGTALDMRLYTGEQDRAWVDTKLSDKRVRSSGGYAVLAPTSRWEGKRWPAERFAEVAKKLLTDGRIGIGSVIVVGGPGVSEAAQAAPLIELSQRDARIVSFVGATSVGRLMALVERSSLVVANDSAALHMAVGFDRPFVALFGPTDLALVGPYTRGLHHPAAVLQHVDPGETFDHKNDALGREYMQRISVDEVITAIREVTKAERQSSRVITQ